MRACVCGCTSSSVHSHRDNTVVGLDGLVRLSLRGATEALSSFRAARRWSFLCIAGSSACSRTVLNNRLLACKYPILFYFAEDFLMHIRSWAVRKTASHLQCHQDFGVALVGKRFGVQSGVESFQGLRQGLCIQLELS